MSISVDHKLSEFGTTIFTVMSLLASRHNAINLSQGFPDFDGPVGLRERVAWHLNHGHNQYAPLAGVPVLREQIAVKVEKLYGASINPEAQVTVTPGATEAIYCAITAVTRPGDEVIMFDPAYDTYDPCVQLNGGIPVHIPLRYPDYRVDWDKVENALTDRTRLIIINSPHNPTGSVLSETDMQRLQEIVKGKNIILVSDEVYEHIVFDGHQHQSILRYPDLAKRAFVISSFGKTYHVTGWRVGYCVAPEFLMQDFLKIHQFINFSTNTPMQFALADFMTSEPDHVSGLGAFYQEKRDFFSELMSATRFNLLPSGGTYFQLAQYGGISDLNDREFCEWLTREKGVAAIPVSAFYQRPDPEHRVIRFCFAKNDETLKQAAQQLEKV